ncbi:type II pantothenate kinase, partial [Staphylococcus aureus]|nr:type II pantothenate kinase [Staphylococcus aureus]
SSVYYNALCLKVLEDYSVLRVCKPYYV